MRGSTFTPVPFEVTDAVYLKSAFAFLSDCLEIRFGDFALNDTG